MENIFCCGMGEFSRRFLLSRFTCRSPLSDMFESLVPTFHYSSSLFRLGLLVAAYAMVLIEAEADEAYVRNGGKPVHARRFLHEDIAVGWVGILLFGPGFGLATFFGRREMMAEKARWGVTSKSE